MKGFVEAVAEHEARGWAFDEAIPDEHVSISVWLDGHQVGKAIANTMRSDLQVAGIGNGDHEFRVSFQPLLSPTVLSRLEIRAESGNQPPAKLAMLRNSNHSRADQASDATIPFRDETQHPVFILGPARSGTSALALALLKSGRYEGYGEGHLLPLAHTLLATVDTYYAARKDLGGVDTFLRAVHHETFQRAIRRSFVQLGRGAYPSGYWLDKTPTAAMVRAAPLMLEIWPNARFIFLKRRVIENILSRRRKFPQDTLQNHYLDWVDVLSAWLDVRDQLSGAAIEVDQLEMARENDKLAGKVSDFLTIPPNQAELLRQALASDHPEQTSSAVGISASLESLALPPDDLRELRIACDHVMSVFGYGYGTEYFSSDRSHALA